MKKIITYIKDFWQLDFDFKVYGTVLIGLMIAIFFNFKYDFEDSILDSYRRQPISFLYYFLFYASAYYFVIFIYWIYGTLSVDKRQIESISGTHSSFGLSNKWFWITSLFILLLLSFKVFFHYYDQWIPKHLPLPDRYALQKGIRAFVGVLIYLIGIAGFYLFVDKKKSNWYGLTTKGFNWRPYAIMLAIMVPLIAIAATQPDFLKVYPRLKLAYFQEDYLKYFLAYEPFYLMGFVVLEWLFRGMLIIGLVRYLGHRAILPMAVLYCVIHFGKPLGECISSVFGGYLLGIFAYYSRSIWGGIIVHMGIALLMDLAAITAWMLAANG